MDAVVLVKERSAGNLPHLWWLGSLSLLSVVLSCMSACSLSALPRSLVGLQRLLLTPHQRQARRMVLRRGCRGPPLTLDRCPRRCGPWQGLRRVRLFPVASLCSSCACSGRCAVIRFCNTRGSCKLLSSTLLCQERLGPHGGPWAPPCNSVGTAAVDTFRARSIDRCPGVTRHRLLPRRAVTSQIRRSFPRPRTLQLK